MLTILLTIVHIIVSLFLILVVLLQQGKSADIAGAFGGGGSQMVFGQRTQATTLTKATTIAAVAFMVTSLGLSILAARPGANSVIREGATPAPAATPATPAPATPAPATPTSPAPAGTTQPPQQNPPEQK